MKMVDFLFYMFYCFAREQGPNSWPRYKAAAAGIGGIVTLFAGSVICLMFGITNTVIKGYPQWLTIGMLCATAGIFFINKFYLKSDRYEIILLKYSGTSKSQKKIYSFLTFFFILFFSALMYLSAFAMKRLWDLHI